MVSLCIIIIRELSLHVLKELKIYTPILSPTIILYQFVFYIQVTMFKTDPFFNFSSCKYLILQKYIVWLTSTVTS